MQFRSNGKLLLSSEYYVLDGALALALPTQMGQVLDIKELSTCEGILYWKSLDNTGELWFETILEMTTLQCKADYACLKALKLQKILQTIRLFSPQFLQDAKHDLYVETRLEFPRLWGLGSSSTLIYNLASWAKIDAFELLFHTLGGSGYDVACASAEGSILYQNNNNKIHKQTAFFNPSFKNQLFFVYLGKKQSSEEGIQYYKQLQTDKSETITQLSELTQKMLDSTSLEAFEAILVEHEKIISSTLQMKTVKEKLFSDYWGMVKSLGAWGGDFVMVTSQKTKEETQRYFLEKGYEVFLEYEAIILDKNASIRMLATH